MVMNPRTHPRGAAPDFELPRPNPNPDRQTDALWWFVCMCELLEPASQNGGTYANKAGYHNIGNNLPDHGAGHAKTDHSIRRAPDRRGPWWRTKTAGRDWTFPDAQRGDYKTIIKYTKRMINAMKSLTDLRPDEPLAYVLGQVDGDPVVEGWNEYTDDPETSADKSHLWHIHESWKRDQVGSFWAMWKILTIYMGWTYQEWLESTKPPAPERPDDTAEEKAEMDFWASAAKAARGDADATATDRNNRNNAVQVIRFALGLQVDDQTGANLPSGEDGQLARIETALGEIKEQTAPPVESR